MKWPFIEYRSTGIYLGSKRVSLVTLGRIRDHVRIIHAEDRELAGQEPLAALEDLLEQFDLSDSTVSTNVDLSKAKCINKRLSVSLDEINNVEWLKEYSQSLLPNGLKNEDFTEAHIIATDNNTQPYCNSLLARTETFQPLIELFNNNEINLTQLTCGSWCAGYAFLFDPDFVKGQKAVLSLYGNPMLVIYSDGQFLTSKGLTVGGGAEELLLEAESEFQQLEGASGRDSNEIEVVLATPSKGKQQELIACSNSLGFKREVRTYMPLQNLSGDSTLGLNDIPAAGMAVAGLYNDLHQINLLPGEQEKASTQKIQKRDAISLILGVGGITLLLLVTLNLFQWYQGTKLAQTEKQLLKVSGKLTQKNKLQKSIKNLKSQLSGAQQLVLQRTQTAKMLDKVGMAIPSNVWLTGIEHSTEQNNEVIINGFTTTDRKVSQFLERLEELAVTEDIRLKFSESATAEELEANDSLRFENFTLFRIQGRTTL